MERKKRNVVFFSRRMGIERHTLLQILQHQALLGKGGGAMQEVSGSIVDNLLTVLPWNMLFRYSSILRLIKIVTRPNQNYKAN